MSPESRGPTRRELLAGALGGVAGLAGGAGLWSLRDSAQSGSPPSGDLPYLVGKPEPSLPQGVVRADLRAFQQGSGSDYGQAFVDALEAADAVYVPAGQWRVDKPVQLPTGKALWSDGGFDFEDRSNTGAVILATAAMPAVVRLSGASATLSGVNVDGAELADAAIEFAADSLLLDRVSAKGGKTHALKATGNFCTIWGGFFQQVSNSGYAVFHQGTDLIMGGARVKRGRIPLWVDGSGGLFGLIHVTGKTDPASASSATVRVTGSRNQFMNVFYDSALGPSLLLEAGGNGNRFIGMTVRNSGSDRSFPVIRCDARQGQVRNNRFDAFHTDAGQGSGWSAFVEFLGPAEAYSGNELGSGHADGCRALWNLRPSAVGDIVSDAKLSANAGAVQLGRGQKRLVIPHRLVEGPRSVNITPSTGGAGPNVTVSREQLLLEWSSPPGPMTVYWSAQM